MTLRQQDLKPLGRLTCRVSRATPKSTGGSYDQPALPASNRARIVGRDTFVFGTVRRLSVARVAGNHAVLIQEVHVLSGAVSSPPSHPCQPNVLRFSCAVRNERRSCTKAINSKLAHGFRPRIHHGATAVARQGCSASCKRLLGGRAIILRSRQQQVVTQLRQHVQIVPLGPYLGNLSLLQTHQCEPP